MKKLIGLVAFLIAIGMLVDGDILKIEENEEIEVI